MVLERKITGFRSVPEYTNPFTKENVKELYAKADPNGVSLVIQKVDANGQTAGHPYLIEKYQDFIGLDPLHIFHAILVTF